MFNRHERLRRDGYATCRALKTFDSLVQEYGTFFAGFAWQIYGCLTYRNPVGLEVAQTSLTDYLRRLTWSLGKAPVSCIAVLEHRYSGCSNYAIPRHWHLLMATSSTRRHLLLESAQCIWSQSNGNHKIEPYDPHRGGAHYLAKHAGKNDFEYRAERLERMTYNGPQDLYQSHLSDPYVPDHVRGISRARTLRLRDTRASKKILNPHEQGIGAHAQKKEVR